MRQMRCAIDVCLIVAHGGERFATEPQSDCNPGRDGIAIRLAQLRRHSKNIRSIKRLQILPDSYAQICERKLGINFVVPGRVIRQ